MVSAILGDTSVAPLVRVTLGGSVRDDGGTELLAELGPAVPRTSPRPGATGRVEEECRTIRTAGYGPAVTELIRLGLELKRRGHTMFVQGAAAGSALFHLVGLTPLDPLEHGLFTERFIDSRLEGGRPPASRAANALDYFFVRVSMGQADFLTLLRQRGYSFGMEADTIPAYPVRTITASKRAAASGGRSVQLAVEASSLAVLSNLAGHPDRDEIPDDIQTWHLLAAGDTDGIEPLESPVVQDALRSRKPRSLQSLADVLAVTRPGAAGEWEREIDAKPVYQEDLMQLLHDRLGVSLRDAYDLVAGLGAPNGGGVVEIRERFFGIKPPEPLSPREWNRLWEQLVNECPLAVCKAHYLLTAYLCLRAAYVKAHHPEDFRAMLASVSA